MIFRIMVLLVIPYFIQAQDANEVIKKLQNKFDTIKNFESNFSQTITSAQGQESINFDGEFYFKKENSFAIVLPNRSIISDGESIWNYDKSQNKAVISIFENDDATFSLDKIIYSYPEKCKLSLIKNGENNFIVKATPRNMELSFKEAYLTIDKYFILNKVEIIDFNNMKFIFALHSTKINENIDNSKFQFTPTNEVEIIDLR
jgi:outer membrane lipoprotein carrier protein